MQSLVVYTDGACRGNPGPAATGWLIRNEHGQIIDEGGSFLGRRTNNEAEYEAVIEALSVAGKHSATHVLLRSDSELLIRQINGQYRVKNARLLPLYQRVQQLRREFETTVFEHVRREFNREADAAANAALDEGLRRQRIGGNA